MLDNLHILLPMLGVVLLAGIVGYFFLKSKSKEMSKKLEPIANYFGGKIISKMGWGSIDFNYDGHDMSILLTMGSKNNPRSLTISCKTPMSFTVSIRNKQKVSFAEKLAPGRNALTTGDPYLDNECVIRTRDTEWVESYFQSAEKIAIVKDLFENGFYNIYMNPKGPSATIERYTDDDLQIDKIRTSVEKLHELIQ